MTKENFNPARQHIYTPRECPVCDNIFTPTSGNQVYCPDCGEIRKKRNNCRSKHDTFYVGKYKMFMQIKDLPLFINNILRVSPNEQLYEMWRQLRTKVKLKHLPSKRKKGGKL